MPPQTKNQTLMKNLTAIIFKLKDKQYDILILLYRFRFLNRHQIQQLLNHKYFSKIITWLNELTEHKYIHSKFKRQVVGVPSVYCLRSKAKKDLVGKDGIKESLLDRVYSDKYSSKTFQSHCMLLADIYISLLKLVKLHNAKLKFHTKTDLDGMRYLPIPCPDAYFSIEESKDRTKRYFLDIFDPAVSEKWLVKRVWLYHHYYSKNYWQDHNKNSFPEIIFVYANSNAKKVLEDTVKKILERESRLSFYLTTWEEVKTQGIKKETLHKVIL